MKKYRLIKTYPGSPVLGFEIEKSGASTYVGGSGNTFQIRKEYIEYHSEFWEEVIEKDYEILCIKHKKSKCFYRNSINLRNLNLYDIHSVKRLSDGEVFTVGDRINHYGEYAKNEFSTKTYTLKEIYFIEENKLTFYVGKSFNLGAISASKYKLPLFTTEDGVDIFEGDLYHAVTKKNNKMLINLNAEKEASNFPPIWSMKDFICFSYRKKAQEYIDKNKPLFTTEDGIQIFKGDECWAIDKTDLDHLGKVDFRNNHPYDYALYFSNEKKAQKYIKENKPLFVTEDGVNIFKGDKAYECARNGKCYNKSNRFTPLNSERHNYTSIGKSWIVFSTEKKAEEYILLNKPCICLKDLIEAFFPKDYNFNNRKSEGAIEDISVNLLISLFKLKLKEK